MNTATTPSRNRRQFVFRNYQKMLMLRPVFTTLFSIIAFISCNNLYKAGNLVDLGYPIETTLRTEIVKRYVDTLIQKKGYAVPHKWEHFDKLVDLDSVSHKRIYFKSNPEEMYLISYGGMLVLSDVYNPQLNEYDWVGRLNECLTRKS